MHAIHRRTRRSIALRATTAIGLVSGFGYGRPVYGGSCVATGPGTYLCTGAPSPTGQDAAVIINVTGDVLLETGPGTGFDRTGTPINQTGVAIDVTATGSVTLRDAYGAPVTGRTGAIVIEAGGAAELDWAGPLRTTGVGTRTPLIVHGRDSVTLRLQGDVQGNPAEPNSGAISVRSTGDILVEAAGAVAGQNVLLADTVYGDIVIRLSGDLRQGRDPQGFGPYDLRDFGTAVFARNDSYDTIPRGITVASRDIYAQTTGIEVVNSTDGGTVEIDVLGGVTANGGAIAVEAAGSVRIGVSGDLMGNGFRVYGGAREALVGRINDRGERENFVARIEGDIRDPNGAAYITNRTGGDIEVSLRDTTPVIDRYGQLNGGGLHLNTYGDGNITLRGRSIGMAGSPRYTYYRGAALVLSGEMTGSRIDVHIAELANLNAVGHRAQDGLVAYGARALIRVTGDIDVPGTAIETYTREHVDIEVGGTIRTPGTAAAILVDNDDASGEGTRVAVGGVAATGEGVLVRNRGVGLTEVSVGGRVEVGSGAAFDIESSGGSVAFLVDEGASVEGAGGAFRFAVAPGAVIDGTLGGTVVGHLGLGSGEDSLVVTATGVVTGTADGGDGNDRLGLSAGEQGRTVAAGDFVSFETIRLNDDGTGRLTLAGTSGTGAVATLDTGSGGGTSVVLAAGELNLRETDSSVRAQAVRLEAGTMLTGNGRILGDTEGLGTIAPGNSVGQLTFNGNLVLGASATPSCAAAFAPRPRRSRPSTSSSIGLPLAGQSSAAAIPSSRRRA